MVELVHRGMKFCPIDPALSGRQIRHRIVKNSKELSIRLEGIVFYDHTRCAIRENVSGSTPVAVHQLVRPKYNHSPQFYIGCAYIGRGLDLYVQRTWDALKIFISLV